MMHNMRDRLQGLDNWIRLRRFCQAGHQIVIKRTLDKIPVGFGSGPPHDLPYNYINPR